LTRSLVKKTVKFDSGYISLIEREVGEEERWLSFVLLRVLRATPKILSNHAFGLK
jgi:hypothetical protein